MDTGDILEASSEEDPTLPNDDADDEFEDLYADPGEVLDLDEVDLS